MAAHQAYLAGQEGVRAETARIAALRAETDVLDTEIAQARKARRDAVVRAPIDGTVLEVSARVGELAQGEAGAPDTAAHVSLGDLERLQVRAFVDETQLGAFDADLKATLIAPCATGRCEHALTFVRTARSLRPRRDIRAGGNALIDQRALEVIYELENTDAAFAGQVVDVELSTRTEADAARVADAVAPSARAPALRR